MFRHGVLSDLRGTQGQFRSFFDYFLTERSLIKCNQILDLLRSEHIQINIRQFSQFFAIFCYNF